MTAPARGAAGGGPVPLSALPADRRLGETGLALLSGVGLATSLPPLGWWPVAPVAFAALARLVDNRPWRSRALLGLAAGYGHFAIVLSWAADFSTGGYLALITLESLFFSLALALTATRRWAVAAFPAAWVLAEAARSSWPFGGLPLGGIALGQAGSPLAPVATLAGGLGVVAAAALLGATLAAAVQRRGRLAGVCLAVVVATIGMGRMPFTDGGERIRVAVVQGGGPRGTARVDSDPAEVLRRHLDASGDVGRGTDLVLWPEDVIDTARAFAGSAEEDELLDLSRRQRVTLVAGVVEGAGPGRFRNAAVAFAPDGAVADRYDKVHRVPFGEYVPARGFFRRLADLSAVPRDAIPGRGPGVLDTPAGRLGVVISFEVFFPNRARAAVRAGGRILLVPTNASSYTGQMVPAQELAAARLRAWETGRPVVQAAPTGYSAFVSPTGEVRSRSRLGPPAVLEGDVRLRSGLTPYARLGDRPLLAVSGLILVRSRWTRRDSRRRRSPPDQRRRRGGRQDVGVRGGGRWMH